MKIASSLVVTSVVLLMTTAEGSPSVPRSSFESGPGEAEYNLSVQPWTSDAIVKLGSKSGFSKGHYYELAVTNLDVLLKSCRDPGPETDPQTGRTGAPLRKQGSKAGAPGMLARLTGFGQTESDNNHVMSVEERSESIIRLLREPACWHLRILDRINEEGGIPKLPATKWRRRVPMESFLRGGFPSRRNYFSLEKMTKREAQLAARSLVDFAIVYKRMLHLDRLGAHRR